jgi:hypothetical protein
MKRHTTALTILLLSVLLIKNLAWGQATLPVIEHFNYSVDQLKNVGTNWSRVSGSSNDLNVVAGNLTYSGYLMIAVGNQVSISSSGSDDDKLTFTSQSTVGTTIYASFLLNVTNTTGLNSGDHFADLGNGSSTYSARVYIKLSGAGFQLGIARNSTTVSEWNGTDLSVGTTYLVVVAYTIVSGPNNDIARLWVNPNLAGGEPPTTLIDNNTIANDASSIDGFFIRQGSGTPNANLDGLRIGLSWNDVITIVDAAPIIVPNKLVLAQNYPNPFNPATTVEFVVPVNGYAILKVYNMLGQEIAILFNGNVQAGLLKAVSFNGARFTSGVYYYTIEYRGQRLVKRMLLLK